MGAWGKVLVSLSLLVWAASFSIGFESALLLLSLVGLGTAVAGLRWPGVGLLGVGMLCTLETVTRAYLLSGGLWRWNSFSYWLLIVTILSLPALLRWSGASFRFLQGLIALLAIELVVSDDVRGGLQHLLGIVSLLGLLVYYSRGSRERLAGYWMAVVTGCLAGAGSVAFYLQQDALPYINENAWSYFPLTALFAITLTFQRPTGQRRDTLTLSVLAVVNSFWVFLSGSRGSMLVAASCVLFILVKTAKSRQAYVFAGSALVVCLVVGAFFAERSGFGLRRIEQLLDTKRSLGNRTSGRSELAAGGWHIFLERPLGVGTGGFAPTWASLVRLRGWSEFAAGEQAAAHSGWIKVLAENGLPGVVLLGGFVVSFAVVGWHGRRAGLLAVGILATTALGLAFLSTEFQEKGLWLFVAGVMTMLRPGGVRTPSPKRATGSAPRRPRRAS